MTNPDPVICWNLYVNPIISSRIAPYNASRSFHRGCESYERPMHRTTLGFSKGVMTFGEGIKLLISGWLMTVSHGETHHTTWLE